MASAKCRMTGRALVLVASFLGILAFAGRPAGADPTAAQVAPSQTELAQLETTIANEQQRSAALDAAYVAAQAQLSQVESQLARTRGELEQTRRQVLAEKRHLARDAVYAYVYGQPAGRIDSLFATSPTDSVAWSQYQTDVVGNITAILGSLDLKEGRLAATTNLEQDQEQMAQNALGQMRALQVANQQAAAAYALSHPSDAGSAARNATVDATVALALGDPGAPAAVAAANAAASASGAPRVSGSATGSSAGARAVAAAESQLGVPYVWGGETPGGGFDCSGLTQWAWAQAGVAIPRVAADQAAAVPHVPLDQLEPGDL